MKRTSHGLGIAVAMALALGACGGDGGGGGSDWAASVSYIIGQPLSREELIEIAELISSRLP